MIQTKSGANSGSSQSSASSSANAIVGGVIGAALAVLIVIVIIVVRLRKAAGRLKGPYNFEDRIAALEKVRVATIFANGVLFIISLALATLNSFISPFISFSLSSPHVSFEHFHPQSLIGEDGMVKPREIRRGNVKTLEVLGSGNWGEVHKVSCVCVCVCVCVLLWFSFFFCFVMTFLVILSSHPLANII